jgi:hypothetical protein
MTNKRFKVIINKKSHQISSSECGMYSLYFNIREIENDPIGKNEKIRDAVVEKLRSEYFRPAQLCSLKKN